MPNNNAINDASSAESHARRAASAAESTFEKEIAAAIKSLASAVEEVARKQN